MRARRGETPHLPLHLFLVAMVLVHILLGGSIGLGL